MCMTNISHNTMNTLISRVPCFSFALCLFHTSRLSGVSCPFAVFICFKEIWFTQWAMQLGRLLLFHILRCFSLFYPLSVFFAVTIFFLLSATHPLPFPAIYFLERLIIKAKSEKESRLDAPFARQLRGRMCVREKRSWK